MTLKQFREQTEHLPEDSILISFDGNLMAPMQVTGILHGGDANIYKIEFCTDDMNVEDEKV